MPGNDTAPVAPRCRQTLEAELKLLRDDCHRVTLELQERRLRVSRLEAKFGVLSNKGRSLYDDEGPKSQAYYVIKSAQEREELQKQGDTLDGTNQRLQREVCPPLPRPVSAVTQTVCSAGRGITRTLAYNEEKDGFDEYQERVHGVIVCCRLQRSSARWSR